MRQGFVILAGVATMLTTIVALPACALPGAGDANPTGLNNSVDTALLPQSATLSPEQPTTMPFQPLGPAGEGGPGAKTTGTLVPPVGTGEDEAPAIPGDMPTPTPGPAASIWESYAPGTPPAPAPTPSPGATVEATAVAPSQPQGVKVDMPRLEFEVIGPARGHDSSAVLLVTLSSAPGGLSGFDASFLLDGPDSNIASVTLPPWFAITQVSTVPSTAVTVRAVDLADAVRPGPGRVALAVVELRSGPAGGFALKASLNSMDDDRGYPVIVEPAEARAPLDLPASRTGQ